MAVEFEPMIGRYFTLNIGGDPCRIYMEESGSGIPLLCLHTAGSDSRQFRHILSDPDITSRFRVIAFDLPCCLLYTSPSPRDGLLSRMPSSA